MSKFDQTVRNFYSGHEKASEALDFAERSSTALAADAKYTGEIALRNNDAVLHQQARERFREAEIAGKLLKTAQRKYDENLISSAAHKNRYLDKYIATATAEMIEYEADKAAVVSAAEEFLRQADAETQFNPNPLQAPPTNEHPEV